METTLALLLLLITLNYYWQINNLPQSKTRSWIFLGILLGIGFWARTDLGLLGVAIVIDQAWQSFRTDAPVFSVRIRNIIFCTLTALVVACSLDTVLYHYNGRHYSSERKRGTSNNQPYIRLPQS